MYFKEFISKWRDGTIHHLATWRAYDFEASVKPRHLAKALKQLGLSYAGDLAVSNFMRVYGFTDRREAEVMLGSWWLMDNVEKNGRSGAFVKPRPATGDLFPDPTLPKPSPDPRTIVAK